MVPSPNTSTERLNENLKAKCTGKCTPPCTCACKSSAAFTGLLLARVMDTYQFKVCGRPIRTQHRYVPSGCQRMWPTADEGPLVTHMRRRRGTCSCVCIIERQLTTVRQLVPQRTNNTSNDPFIFSMRLSMLTWYTTCPHRTPVILFSRIYSKCGSSHVGLVPERPAGTMEEECHVRMRPRNNLWKRLSRRKLVYNKLTFSAPKRQEQKPLLHPE